VSQRSKVKDQRLENHSEAKPVPILASCQESISQAAAAIASGGIGAIPTETVYGLGADAVNPVAVARIYEAKGRPGDNPLILHIASREDFFRLADNPPSYAHALIDAFWPGPLTLVTKKKPGLQPWLGGHPNRKADTIGIRMPSHPMALTVIKASGCFIAAPSANKAGTPSPTRADHVAADFGFGEIDFILDGGAVPGGLESTVVDVTGEVPVILRPGAISPEMAAKVTGLEPLLLSETTLAPRAPGMKYRHYAPKAPMMLLVGDERDIAAYIAAQCASVQAEKIGILVTSQTRAMLDTIPVNNSAAVLTLGDKTSPETIARNLYACLRQFDILNVDIIYAEGPSQDGLGLAIMDRMKKAAEGRVIHVSN